MDDKADWTRIEEELAASFGGMPHHELRRTLAKAIVEVEKLRVRLRELEATGPPPGNP